MIFEKQILGAVSSLYFYIFVICMKTDKLGFGTSIVNGLFYLAGRLPLGWHYFWGRVFAWVLGKVVHYREDVVTANIARSFPEKKYDEYTSAAGEMIAYCGKTLPLPKNTTNSGQSIKHSKMLSCRKNTKDSVWKQEHLWSRETSSVQLHHPVAAALVATVIPPPPAVPT